MARDAETKVLYSSGELHSAIKKVLDSPEPGDRRVVLVAFVGGKAGAFLPSPNGLEIVCWLQPGSTDALALERLQKRGARLFKAERMHMKVYWSTRRGCVICSANLSGKALGAGDQKEAGVWLPPGAVDIERLLKEARPQPMKPTDLKRLTRENDRVIRNGTRGIAALRPHFLEWRNLAGRRDWKLEAWEDYARFTQGALNASYKSYGVKEPCDYLDTKKGRAKSHDWILSFRSPDVSDITWLYVDFVIEVPPTDKAAYIEGYSSQAVQVHTPDNYRPPFKIDQAFISAFKIALDKYGVANLERRTSPYPPKRLLNLIADELGAT